jgi:hypothetical protein
VACEIRRNTLTGSAVAGHSDEIELIKAREGLAYLANTWNIYPPY